MNGNSYGPVLSEFDPSWLDSGGIPGIEPEYPPFDQDDQEWDTDADTRGGETGDDFNPPC